jgi:hypothetical protein
MYLGVPFYALMDFDYLFKNKNTKKKKKKVMGITTKKLIGEISGPLLSSLK